MENIPNIVKIIASFLIALAIGSIFGAVLFGAMGLNIKDYLSVSVIILIVVLSLPFYVIIKKKLFK